MCCEDLQIGRESQSNEQTVAVAATGSPIVGFSNNRIALVFGPPVTNNVWLTTQSAGAVGTGILLRTTDPPMKLDIQRYGDLVRSAWIAFPAAATATITVFEVSNSKTCNGDSG